MQKKITDQKSSINYPRFVYYNNDSTYYYYLEVNKNMYDFVSPTHKSKSSMMLSIRKIKSIAKIAKIIKRGEHIKNNFYPRFEWFQFEDKFVYLLKAKNGVTLITSFNFDSYEKMKGSINFLKKLNKSLPIVKKGIAE